jgi:hypothetical protein
MRRGSVVTRTTGALLSAAIVALSVTALRPAVGAEPPAGTRTVRVDEEGVHRIGKLRVRHDLKATTTLRAALGALGKPSSKVSMERDNLCRVSWRRLRLSADFRRSIHVGGTLRCEPDFYFDRARVTTGWKTDMGLKVGAPTSAIRSAYSQAKLVKGKWELVTNVAAFSGTRQWLLAALTRSGRVTTLLATVGELD